MLRLEKKRADVNITVRDRHRSINRPFLYALAIAVSMHLLAVLVFHIHSFLASSDYVLPPTQVEIDANSILEDAAVLALSDPDGRAKRHILAPIASSPKVPEMAPLEIAREMEYLQVEPSLDNPFLAIEENWQYLNQKPETTKRPIQIHVAGELANSILINDGLEKLAPKITHVNDMAIYQVRVERKSGRIFWFQTTKPFKNQNLNIEAEKILHLMAFQPSPQGFVDSGEIEIRFNAAKEETL